MRFQKGMIVCVLGLPTCSRESHDFIGIIRGEGTKKGTWIVEDMFNQKDVFSEEILFPLTQGAFYNEKQTAGRLIKNGMKFVLETEGRISAAVNSALLNFLVTGGLK